jgi:phytoene dehydrogenase-like protein
VSQWDVVVVGAGLAGLNCARLLTSGGCRVAVVDSDDAVGGRVRTDRSEGFCFDRGFQVLQTAYPEAKKALDYSGLRLAAFEPGAIIQTVEKRAVMSDPWRRPLNALKTLANGVGTFGDRLKLAKLRADAARQWSSSSAGGRRHDDCSVSHLLNDHYKFSSDFINRFLRPWISGMFFDERLLTSAEFFKFVFHMLSTGDASLPAGGVQSMPEQLAKSLDIRSIFLGRAVTKVDEAAVELSDGRRLNARFLVLALPSYQLQSLVPNLVGVQSLPEFAATECYYFSSPVAPPIGKYLMLNGELDGEFQAGSVSNVTVPSNVCSDYSPPGVSLICVTIRPSLVPNDSQLVYSSGEVGQHEAVLRAQLRSWFGGSVDQWRFLRSYRVIHAIPRWLPRQQTTVESGYPETILFCGDYLESPSINGALASGRKAAEKILSELR